MGGNDAHREPFIIDAEEFIGVKTFKAKGRRVTNWEVTSITEIEPREPAATDEQVPTIATTDNDETPAQGGISQEEVLDQLTGQQRLPFDDIDI